MDKYKIIYADPPWKYKDIGTINGLCTNHYGVMKLNDIKKLPVCDMADDNAALFLWVPPPKLDEALEVIKAWGFIYKTVGFTWIKQNKKSDGFFMGLGFYTRSNAEFCLLATKGRGVERKSKSVRQLVISRLREHSRKPDEVRDRIVELFGDIPRIELFARTKTPGWDVWGNETNKFIN